MIEAQNYVDGMGSIDSHEKLREFAKKVKLMGDGNPISNVYKDTIAAELIGSRIKTEIKLDQINAHIKRDLQKLKEDPFLYSRYCRGN